MRIALLALAVALLLTACGGDAAEPETGGPPAPVGVEIRQIYDMSEGGYVEGAYSYVRVERPDGTTVDEIRLEDGGAAGEARILSTGRLALAPGSYRLVSYQRPCEGNCGSLDPPTDECSTDLRVEEGAPVDVKILVLPAQSCTIELR